MRNQLSSYVAVLATATTILTLVQAGDNCAQGSTEINGNYYCQPVNTIQYSGLGAAGTYNRITEMDSTNGACSSTQYAYSGGLSPLDEEVSFHFRGPLNLKQFAVYVPQASAAASKAKAKRETEEHVNLHARDQQHGHGRGHGHAHFHKHNKEVRELQEKAEVGRRDLPEVWVTAVIDGQTVSWVNDWTPGEATASATVAAAVAVDASSVAASLATSVLQSAALQNVATTLLKSTTFAAVAASSTLLYTTSAVVGASSTLSSSAYASSSAAVDTSTDSLTPGAWTRTAYYDSASGSSSGLAFLNHYGGSGSGTFDYVFGNSLSYSNCDGSAGSATSTVLENTMIASNKEVVVMSDETCDDDSCNFYRNGTVAHHGFGGSQKLFMLEFDMPDDGTSGWNMNMPAIWMLNAEIPRTLQYGAADCSCWTTGCGELDLFEVLDSGNTRCKSTYHGNIQGGDSDYFVRPTNGTIQAAVTLNGETVTIKVLSSTGSFKTQLSAKVVKNYASSSVDVSGLVSLFTLGSS